MKLRHIVLSLAAIFVLAAADLPAQSPQPNATSGTQSVTSPTQSLQGRRGGGRFGGPGARGGGRRPATGNPARYGIYLPGAEPGERHTGFVIGRPTLWLVGDSTVKNGREDGREGGLWGWGDEIAPYFDPMKMNVENQALGGTSSYSYMAQGWWGAVTPYIQPGDYVMIQFGHNDAGTPPGNGDETASRPSRRGGAPQEMHSFGWNIRKYIQDARERGATPIVCSLIPRDAWKDGKVLRGQDDSYTLWAQQAAEQEGAYFINLNHIIAERMDPLGEGFATGTLFPKGERVHTSLIGATFNAMCVVSGVKALGEKGLKLAELLSPTAGPVDSAPDANVAAGKMTEGPAPRAN